MRKVSNATPRRRCRHARSAKLLLTAPLLLAAAGLAGCALGSRAEREVSAAIREFEQHAFDDAQHFARTVAQAPATRPVAAPPATRPAAAEPKTLRDYIALALARNPEIKAAERSARAKVARVAQVTAPPDPVLMTRTLIEPVRTAEGDNYFVLGVQQKLPLPAKLDRAGRIAWQEARMALEDLRRTRLRVIAGVKRAYYRLYVIDKTAAVDRANQDLLRGLIDAARAQVAAGRRSQDDVLRAQVELSTLDSRLIELAQQRTTVVALLNRLLDRPVTTPIPSPPDFELGRVDREIDRLLRLAAEHNPELRRLRAQIERDRHGLALARLAYWPDLTLGFEWMYLAGRRAFQPPPNPQTGMPAPVNRLSESGSDNWAVLVGLNLPVWFEKIRGGIREARQRLHATQHQYAAARNRVAFEIEDALARVRAQQELAELFAQTIIPQARQAFEVSRSRYAGGAGSFLFVIDNWQKWLTFTVHYYRALGELERSVADLEQAIGLALSQTGE